MAAPYSYGVVTISISAEDFAAIAFILLALLGVAGCCPPWLEPPFQTAFSAVGAQVK
jgi:hypothetical protein